MQQTIEKKSYGIQSSLDNLLTKNINRLHEKVQEWMNFTVKQVQQDLTHEFVKSAVPDPVDWIYIQEHGKEILKLVTLEILESGGNKAYDLFKIKEGFDALSLNAVKAADEIGAKLVVDVTKETRKGIRFAVKEGLKEGKSMDKIAREIRPLVGLTEKQTQSIYNYKAWLREKRPELSSKNIDKRANTYAGRTHRRRAMTIARTEAANAQNVGYVQGLENTGIEQVEFLPAAGACSICEAMRGNKYPLDKAKGIITVHPNCRCCMLPVIGGVPACGGRMKKAECIPPEDLRGEQVDSLLERLQTVEDKGLRENMISSLHKLRYRGVVPKAKAVVKPIPSKASGKLMTRDDEVLISTYSNTWHVPIVQAQIGAPISPEYMMTRTVALKHAKQMEKALLKMPGKKGTYHRGMAFKTRREHDLFLEQYKEGNVFRSASIMSTSTDEGKIYDFARVYGKPAENSIIFHIEGRSARDITKYAVYKEEEHLFVSNTCFKVIKRMEEPYGISGKKMLHVYMKEISD